MTQAQATSSVDRKVILPLALLAVGAVASFLIGWGVLVLVAAMVLALFSLKRVSGRARVILITVLALAAALLVCNLAASAATMLVTDSF